MRYSEDFSRQAKEKSIPNPFVEYNNALRTTITHREDGTRVISFDDDAFKKIDIVGINKRKKTWVAERERYVAQRLFEDFGYTTMLQYREDAINKEDFIPCEGGDRQCHFDCLMRGNCKYRQ